MKIKQHNRNFKENSMPSPLMIFRTTIPQAFSRARVVTRQNNETRVIPKSILALKMALTRNGGGMMVPEQLQNSVYGRRNSASTLSKNIQSVTGFSKEVTEQFSRMMNEKKPTPSPAVLTNPLIKANGGSALYTPCPIPKPINIAGKLPGLTIIKGPPPTVPPKPDLKKLALAGRLWSSAPAASDTLAALNIRGVKKSVPLKPLKFDANHSQLKKELIETFTKMKSESKKNGQEYNKIFGFSDTSNWVVSSSPFKPVGPYRTIRKCYPSDSTSIVYSTATTRPQHPENPLLLSPLPTSDKSRPNLPKCDGNVTIDADQSDNFFPVNNRQQSKSTATTHEEKEYWDKLIDCIKKSTPGSTDKFPYAYVIVKDEGNDRKTNIFGKDDVLHYRVPPELRPGVTASKASFNHDARPTPADRPHSNITSRAADSRGSVSIAFDSSEYSLPEISPEQGVLNKLDAMLREASRTTGRSDSGSTFTSLTSEGSDSYTSSNSDPASTGSLSGTLGRFSKKVRGILHGTTSGFR
ncbi:hypothetical protein [Glaciimonas immobilis]|uniref:Uncharacterized protein n=1 Tax=Glaciimonas immobilis TaxID=728004 RepID=A0A840RU12_9BURK|nr:hypothetical protein [Glaciimonas immobilis]KAF3997735.1 hypothetical protein HAV38_13855 [Glaciimonas immobilis]MBB5200538.1 hypothetical protein [Glaciimonas immobilis]